MNFKNVYTAFAWGFAFLALTVACNNNSSTTQTANDTAASHSAHDGHNHAPGEGHTAPGEPPAAQAPPVTAEPAKTIPDFTFYILKSGIRFSKEDLERDGNITFILFDPSCSHCQHEARDLGEHYDRIKNSNLYFVSMNDPALMSTFLETFAKPLVDKENITVLYDRNADFINKFHIPSQYPATYVYSADGQLKEHWSGTRNIDEIIEAILQ